MKNLPSRTALVGLALVTWLPAKDVAPTTVSAPATVSATVIVADTGTGLAPDVLSKLFEPFYTSKEQGMGLGLSISRSIIEAHGGRIWAERADIGGAAFHFTLARAETENSVDG